MNVNVGTEAAQFLEKEYINGIFVAVVQIRANTVRHGSGTPLKEMKTVLTFAQFLDPVGSSTVLIWLWEPGSKYH